MTKLLRALAACLCVLVCATRVFAQQAPTDGRLLLTVTDPSGGVLPGATVTVVSLEPAAKTTAPTVVYANKDGVATVEHLAPGRYAAVVEMDAFEPVKIAEIRIRTGDNKRTQPLALKKMTDQVTVERDKQVAAADRGSVTFGSSLTREQIEALPDDPTELEKAIRDLAGGDAVLRVDSFEGGRLPDKSQIKAIHISRDQFAAENHYAGGIAIDIITQAGAGPWRGNGYYSLRDSALDGKNPLIPAKGAQRYQSGNFGMNGTVIPNKLSMSFSGGLRRGFNTPTLYAALPGGLLSEAANLRAPTSGLNLYTDITYALTKDQTLRVYYSQDGEEDRNQGVGGYDLTDRAFSQTFHTYSIRGQEAGPLGRRFVTNTKFSYSWSDTTTTSASDALTIRVNDAFTSGGAQRAGGRTTKEFMVQSDLDYVRGMHTVRTGVLLRGGSYWTNDASNYTGTYTFASLAAYQNGTPSTFTKRVGDPIVDYFNMQAGIYIQDDIRLRKNLSLSPGVRYEVQTHLRDVSAIGPRFGITWAPFKSGKTSLRASWGIFTDWMSSGIYEQSLRIDGYRQQELSIQNPAYPNAGAVGTLSIGNRYLIDPSLEMSRNQRLSAGFDQQLPLRLRISATYAYTRVTRAARGENLNAPVNGVRPDPGFNNVIEAVSDGQSRQHSISSNLGWSFIQSTPQLQQQRFNWRRGSMNINYYYGRSLGNYDGAFTPPASGTLATEWGPQGSDVRHRIYGSISSQMLRNLYMNISFNAASAPAYNITTGHDDNGDFFFTDRPAGVSRNSARGDGSWNVNANFNYSMEFGHKGGGNTGVAAPGVVMIGGAGGFVSVMQGSSGPAKYRLGISLNISNLTNHANPIGFSGVLTSPNFGQRTAVAGTRSVSMSMNFGF